MFAIVGEYVPNGAEDVVSVSICEGVFKHVVAGRLSRIRKKA
nr:hypothetical protein [Bacillus pumilus]